jgi:site-specific recombinase XerD
MSQKRSTTTCSGIEWNTLLGLLVQLKRAKRNKEFLLIGMGSYLGLRASDLLNLRWSDVLNKQQFTLAESKTGKIRHLSINSSLSDIITFVSEELHRQDKFEINAYLFSNRNGEQVSLQYINRQLKKTFSDFGVKTQNASTHTLRKTFGKRVWEMDGKSERSLIYLSQIFNHSSISITRRYIGIVQEDIRDIYLRM